MIVDVHDVGHGGCIVVTCPNGQRIMIDCGYRLGPGWIPSITYRSNRIALLVFGNLDEDHLDDLPYVWRDIPIGSIFSNPTVSAAALTAMKREHGMRAGVGQAHAILQTFGPGLIGQPTNLGDV